MNKRDTVSKTISIIDTLSMKCGECLHYKKLPRASRPCCSIEGVRSFATASETCFQPDYTQVITNTDQFAIFAGLLQSFTPKQLKIALVILANSYKYANKKFPFGTKVYIKPTGKDYLSNYLCAFVMGYTSSGQMVISGSPSSTTCGKNFIGYVSPDTCMDYSEWLKKKDELIRKGHIYDTSDAQKKIHTTVDDYEPEIPTIDNAPKEWMPDATPKKKQRLDVYEQITKSFDSRGD